MILCPRELEDVYKLNFQHFIDFGLLTGIDVNKFQFDYTFLCEFLLWRFQESNSIHSLKASRAAIGFYWKMHSSQVSPTESPFVSLFIKGLSRKFEKTPVKSYPISYDELSKIFTNVVGDSSLSDLPLVDLRFITFLVTSYASFGRYEEVSELKIENILRMVRGLF